MKTSRTFVFQLYTAEVTTPCKCLHLHLFTRGAPPRLSATVYLYRELLLFSRLGGLIGEQRRQTTCNIHNANVFLSNIVGTEVILPCFLCKDIHKMKPMAIIRMLYIIFNLIKTSCFSFNNIYRQAWHLKYSRYLYLLQGGFPYICQNLA